MIPSISASKASSQYSSTVFGPSEMTPIDGDKCTHFFHAHAKVTYARSKMHSLDMDGVTVLNELVGKKVRGNNIGLKFGITQAFNIVCWDFVLCVLAACGFDPIFINWVKVLLHAAKLSISVNGSPKVLSDLQ
ncbi:hypothetical protein Patl1_35193 [Pistacia atlantica]|uniref:Uncharacterized protein n=1 Tax=Pistacia atlantica TaxID=434234 RepID=A0ACC0ZT48_9ROSI|nr:hypothetical protein Patl1_35193 [Pistacia atlantica]